MLRRTLRSFAGPGHAHAAAGASTVHHAVPAVAEHPDPHDAVAAGHSHQVDRHEHHRDDKPNVLNWSNDERFNVTPGLYSTFGYFDRRWEPPLKKFTDFISPKIRSAGIKITKAADALMGYRPKEALYRLRRLVAFEGHRPTVKDNCFIAPSAVVIGDVSVGRKVTVGYNAIVRGDLGNVTLGESCTVHDKVVVIGPASVGKWATIDPMCVVDQASVAACSFIGSGTILSKGVHVESGAMVTAASVVLPGTVVSSGEIWSGNPAQPIGLLSEDEKAYIIKAAKHMVLIAVEHSDAWGLTWEEMDDFRIAREHWALWAQDMFEFRVRAFYVREGPRINKNNKIKMNALDLQAAQMKGHPKLGSGWESASVPGQPQWGF
jgi:carbonic anhydrase/acetyltransferase-like protein (isoleucine patch superfamily)